MSDDESHRNRIDRRRFLKLAGASGVAALAVGSGAVSGQTTSRPAHVSMTNLAPDQMQWNQANPSAASQISHYALFDPLAKFNYARGEFEPYLLTDWAFASDGSSMQLNLRSDAVWENGDPVTADDLARQLRLGLLAGEAYSDYVGSVIVLDDTSVEVSFDSDVHPEIAKFDLLEETVLYTHEDNYQTFLDSDDASGYTSFADQDPIASGPWSLASADSQTLALELNEDHPAAAEIDYDYEFDFAAANNEIHARLLNHELDSAFSVFTPPTVVADFPDSVEEVTSPAKFGFGLVPNHDHEHLGDRAVRQAIAYVIDRPKVVEFAGPRSKVSCPKPMGIPSSDQEAALGDAYSDFDAYGSGKGTADASAAVTVLTDAGYTADESGSQVTAPDGTDVSFSLTVPQGWSDWVTAAETIVNQLNEFGFDVTLDADAFGTIYSTRWPNGDFDMIAGSWLPGGGKAAFPYFPLRYQLVDAFWGWTFNYPAANSTSGGTNANVTVPSRTGSGTITVNPASRLETLSTTSDAALTQDIVVEQAWVTNQDLPVIPVAEKLEQSWLTSDDWALPADVGSADVAKVRWPNTWLPRQGEMGYRSGESGTESGTEPEGGSPSTTPSPTPAGAPDHSGPYIDDFEDDVIHWTFAEAGTTGSASYSLTTNPQYVHEGTQALRYVGDRRRILLSDETIETPVRGDAISWQWYHEPGETGGEFLFGVQSEAIDECYQLKIRHAEWSANPDTITLSARTATGQETSTQTDFVGSDDGRETIARTDFDVSDHAGQWLTWVLEWGDPTITVRVFDEGGYEVATLEGADTRYDSGLLGLGGNASTPSTLAFDAIRFTDDTGGGISPTPTVTDGTTPEDTDSATDQSMPTDGGDTDTQTGTDSETETDSTGAGPGFGVASGLAGLGGAAALLRQRLSSSPGDSTVGDADDAGDGQGTREDGE